MKNLMPNERRYAAQKLARLGALTALAVILALVESMLPPLLPMAPGAKIGLGNIVVLLGIITVGISESTAILLVKCLFGAIFGGNWFGLVYSLSGGLVSFAAMTVLYCFAWRRVSVVAVSVVGAVVHNTVQTAVAAAVVRQINFLRMLPLLLVAAVLAGLVVGLVVYSVVKFVPNKILINEIAKIKQNIPKEGIDEREHPGDYREEKAI